MQLSRHALAAVIRENAARLHAPEGIDAVKLLWGLAGNESSFGAKGTPRHEDSYCSNKAGPHAKDIIGLTEMWGCWAHCSYGPWQLMYCNAVGVTPWAIAGDLSTAVSQVILFLNSWIFGRLEAKTLEQIGFAYNHGRLPEAGEDPGAYTAELVRNYAEPLPQ